MPTIRTVRLSCLVLAVIMVAACARDSSRLQSMPADESLYPAAWERIEPSDEFDANSIQALSSPALDKLVRQALDNNFELKRQLARVEETRQGVIVAKAARLPSLSSVITGSRREISDLNNDSSTINNFGLGIDARFEVDLWNQLGTAQQQAQLQFRAEQYEYENQRLDLISNVSQTWFGVLFAKALVGVFEQRVQNIEQNLDIIERGYQQGLNSALDVYLTRSSADQERARLARQEQSLLEQIAALQLLVADYPDGDLNLTQLLPAIDVDINAGIPSQMLKRRPDIQKAWVQMLAQDAALAVAHKQRFPRLVFTGGLDSNDATLGNIFDQDFLLWSLLGNISQPIFEGGRLKAQEEQARQRLIQSEQVYLALINRSFAEVENALSGYRSIQRRLDAVDSQEQNASAAYDLSFQQYQRGLINYATVLEAQQRAFDARSNLLELQYQLLLNRVVLYTALGGTGGETWQN